MGKATLARSLAERWPNLYYLNYDNPDHKLIFIRREWDRTAPLVVLDEVHKAPDWKTLLKGVYDTEGIPPRLLVTGSARVDAHRKGGDSLAGRYFAHRLLPLSVAELSGQFGAEQALDQLLVLGGFPEPFLKGSERAANRWRRLYIERLVREDVRDHGNVTDLEKLSMLLELLRERVGSPLSYASLAGDLQVSPHTIKHWVGVLESLYIVFRVTPYHRNVARAILKAPKVYFYDCALVRNGPGPTFENLAAVSLHKALSYREDNEGIQARLHYIRDKEKREVDFATVVDGRLQDLIEVKPSKDNVSAALRRFAHLFPGCDATQLVRDLDRNRSVDGIQVVGAAKWLAALPC